MPQSRCIDAPRSSKTRRRSSCRALGWQRRRKTAASVVMLRSKFQDQPHWLGIWWAPCVEQCLNSRSSQDVAINLKRNSVFSRHQSIISMATSRHLHQSSFNFNLFRAPLLLQGQPSGNSLLPGHHLKNIATGCATGKATAVN